MPKATPLPSSVHQALQRFSNIVSEREQQEQTLAEQNEQIIEEKSVQLIPMRMLLKSLIDLDLKVRHQRYEDPTAPAQPLSVCEVPSSNSYAPGVSLRLDHPATIEIAIPNSTQRDKFGVVVVHCAQKHPDAHLLDRTFYSMDEACAALAEFIAVNTVSRGRKLPEEV